MRKDILVTVFSTPVSKSTVDLQAPVSTFKWKPRKEEEYRIFVSIHKCSFFPFLGSPLMTGLSLLSGCYRLINKPI